MTCEKNAKKCIKFNCKICNFNTSNKYNYNKHIMSAKHERLTGDLQKNAEKCLIEYKCECGKNYQHRQSLYNHKKKCDFIDKEKDDNSKEEIINNEIDNNFLVNKEENVDYKSMFLEMINENKELRKTITEMIPNMGNNNNNTINSNNKQKFNINVFLNEKCKDAISMDEFIDKIEVSMKNLLTTKEKGQVYGISNIIMENMNKLSLYERPLHCTDKKRETLYVKNNEWEKDDSKEHINKALKKVESKQLKNLNVWLETHPNYMNNPLEQEEFAKLMSECGKSIDDGREKIIKKLCDNVYIEKVEDEAL